jgi:FtsP/CotA-like multicopper oxidase with cupredoxin domain
VDYSFRRVIFKLMVILALTVFLVACSPMDSGGMMNDMMDGIEGNMMDDMMGENMMDGNRHNDDHETSNNHSYLPFIPLSTDSIDTDSIYRPGSITELKGEMSEDGVREFKITASLQLVELKEGITVEGWAYNGQIPGPLLRVKEGERVGLILENNIPGIGTAIHWHGLLVPNDMDGVPPITQPFVREGERFIYEFIAKPAGTFWYHAHSMGDGAEQLDRGLMAPIVIEPRIAESLPETNREWIVTLDEWQVEGAGSAPPFNGDSMRSGGMMNDGMKEGGMNSEMMGGKMMENGMMNSHLLGTADGYNVFTINGRAHPEQPFVAEAGEWVRLRLLNGGFQKHRIHIHGMKAWVTHTDGHLLPAAQSVDELIISPYERLDVFLYGTEPGEYIVHDHTPGHSEAGMQATVKLTSTEQPKIKRGKTIDDHLPIATGPIGAPLYQNLIAGVPGADRTSYDRKYSLTIGMEMGMGSDTQWTINGKGWKEADPFTIRKGDRIRLTISNMSPESHPMHLHGHEFEIVEVDGKTLKEPWLLKDTLNLRPMESITIAFEANNPPGDWLFHCHQGHHADDGLMTLFRYEE